MTAACETCRFWGRERAHDEHAPLGTCRAQPPQAGKYQVLSYHDPDRPECPGPLVVVGCWLWTASDDWCGAYQQRNSSPQQGERE
jgi:hypothetical protein